jgi:ribosomal protein L31E
MKNSEKPMRDRMIKILNKIINNALSGKGVVEYCQKVKMKLEKEKLEEDDEN